MLVVAKMVVVGRIVVGRVVVEVVVLTVFIIATFPEVVETSPSVEVMTFSLVVVSSTGIIATFSVLI